MVNPFTELKNPVCDLILLYSSLSNAFCQGAASHKLADDKGLTILNSKLLHFDDRRVGKLCGGFRLPLRAKEELRFFVQDYGRRDFDGDSAL